MSFKPKSAAARTRRACLALSLAVLTALSVLPPAARSQSGSDEPREGVEIVNGREAVAGRVLLKLRGEQSAAALARLERALDAATNVEVGGAGARLVSSRTKSTKAMLAELSGREDVEYAEPDYIAYGGAVPNDALYGQLYGMRRIGAEEAWNQTTGTRALTVAVSDSGVDYNHPDIAANLWSAPSAFTVSVGGAQTVTCAQGTFGYNAITNTCDPLDDHNHGTHVAGTIGASGNNGVGVAGVNWQTKILAAKWLNANNSGSSSNAIKTIEFVIQVKRHFAGTGTTDIRVINNSWFLSGHSQAVLDQIRRAQENGLLFVAIAGNGTSNNFVGHDNETAPTFPGSYKEPGILTVAATDSSDQLTSFSNFGRTSVHLAAPGASIFSTLRNNTYGFFNGTSMAAPHAAGAANLLLSRCDMTAAGLKGLLLTTVDPLPSLAGKTTSGGRLNVARALSTCLANPNVIDATRVFVRQHYQDFLGREPDAAGLDFWSGGVESCGADTQCREVKRVDTSAAFFLSIEFQETGYFAYRMYQAAFGDIAGKPVPVRRAEFIPDTQAIGQGVEVGVGDWAQRLEANKAAFADGFVARTRFAAAYPSTMTPAEFVDKLNQNAGGALSQEERETLISSLTNNTMTRAQVLRAVAEDQTLKDAEFRQAFVLMQYFGYLRRDPDAPDFQGNPDPQFLGYNFWLGKLNDFNGNYVDAEMVRAFIISIEYRQRFGQ